MTVINTNVSAQLAKNNMDKVQREMENSISKLSSGQRINKAADDAAGMAIAGRMESQIRGLTMAIRHAKDGQNLIDTADGAASEIENALQRMRELAVQSASDTLDSNNRLFLNAEATALKAEIDRIAAQTTWNGMNLLDGSYGSTGAKNIHVGMDSRETIDVQIKNSSSNELGVFQLQGEMGAMGDTQSGVAASGSITAQTLTLNGYVGTDTVAVAIDTNADKVADLINAVTESTGVEAYAVTKARLFSFSAGVDEVRFALHSEDRDSTQSVSISANITSTNDLTVLATAINNTFSTTGISAELAVNKTELIITHASGASIGINDFAVKGTDTDSAIGFSMQALDRYGVRGDDPGFVGTPTITTVHASTTSRSGVVVGQLVLESINAFTVTGDDTTVSEGFFGTEHYGAAPFGGTAAGGTATLNNVAKLSVTTRAGANDAIKALDGAISKINSQRADLGAVSNRLTSVIDNATSMVTNTESSRSHILDTDFASETTKLTRSQILQQAATSMLAQANSSKQGVLALIQNL
jgi:flagellin